MLLRFILYRYDLRVQGMLLRLEFTEKKGDLEPALKTFHEAVDGGDVYHIANTYTITNCYIVFRNLEIGILERFVLCYISNRKHDKCCKLPYMYLMLCCYSNDVQGSRSGGAYGFTVTSLDNLRDTRANKPRMTFMHYIASVSVTIICFRLNHFDL